MLDTGSALSRSIDLARQLTSMIEGLDDDQWSRPTRLPGWTVADLASHCATSLQCQGAAFRNFVAGVPDTPGGTTFGSDPATLPATVRAQCEEYAAAVGAVGSELYDQLVPLPFATLPVSFGCYVVLSEYATHVNDLEWAIGPETSLDAEDAATLLATTTGWVPTTAVAPPAEPFAFVLRGDSGTWTFVPTATGWESGDAGDLPTCEVVGSDSALYLFLFGRIGADHASLTVSGPCAAEAKVFKAVFPGP